MDYPWICHLIQNGNGVVLTVVKMFSKSDLRLGIGYAGNYQIILEGLLGSDNYNGL